MFWNYIWKCGNKSLVCRLYQLPHRLEEKLTGYSLENWHQYKGFDMEQVERYKASCLDHGLVLITRLITINYLFVFADV